MLDSKLKTDEKGQIHIILGSDDLALLPMLSDVFPSI